VPCGTQGANGLDSRQLSKITLWSPGVKPAAPMKMETRSEFVGDQLLSKSFRIWDSS